MSLSGNKYVVSRLFPETLFNHSTTTPLTLTNKFLLLYQAMAARLEALENDAAVQDTFAAGSDDEEFVLRDESEGGNFSSSLSIVVTCWNGLFNFTLIP
jgi:hypothetical protein